MNTSLPTKDTDATTYAFFEATDFGPIEAYGAYAIGSTEKTKSYEPFLDGFLAAIKWIFLYAPGVAAVHFLMLGFALFFHYQDWNTEVLMIAKFSGTYIICMFMIMLGIGKLKDLRYLTVVASVFGATAMLSVIYSILIAFWPGDYFGFYAKLTLPLALLTGYLVKKNKDRRSDDVNERVKS